MVWTSREGFQAWCGRTKALFYRVESPTGAPAPSLETGAFEVTPSTNPGNGHGPQARWRYMGKRRRLSAAAPTPMLGRFVRSPTGLVIGVWILGHPQQDAAADRLRRRRLGGWGALAGVPQTQVVENPAHHRGIFDA